VDPGAYHDARLVASGCDIYELEWQWRDRGGDSELPERGPAFPCAKHPLANLPEGIMYLM
jgi:hypothetical protein